MDCLKALCNFCQAQIAPQLTVGALLITASQLNLAMGREVIK